MTLLIVETSSSRVCCNCALLDAAQLVEHSRHRAPPRLKSRAFYVKGAAVPQGMRADTQGGVFFTWGADVDNAWQQAKASMQWP